MNPSLTPNQTEPTPQEAEPIQAGRSQQPQGLQINMAELSKLFGENQTLKKAHRRHAWVQFMASNLIAYSIGGVAEASIKADEALAEYDERTSNGRL